MLARVENVKIWGVCSINAYYMSVCDLVLSIDCWTPSVKFLNAGNVQAHKFGVPTLTILLPKLLSHTKNTLDFLAWQQIISTHPFSFHITFGS
jgi:hypothetical protein